METMSGEFVSFHTELKAKEEEVARPRGMNPGSASRLSYLPAPRDDAKMRNLRRSAMPCETVRLQPQEL